MKTRPCSHEFPCSYDSLPSLTAFPKLYLNMEQHQPTKRTRQPYNTSPTTSNPNIPLQHLKNIVAFNALKTFANIIQYHPTSAPTTTSTPNHIIIYHYHILQPCSTIHIAINSHQYPINSHQFQDIPRLQRVPVPLLPPYPLHCYHPPAAPSPTPPRPARRGGLRRRR